MIPLPIDAHLDAIADALRSAGAVVVVAEPGAGKTTRLPAHLLQIPAILGDEHPEVVVLQPRRVAARAVAARIAEERGWPLGGRVGYQVRFERRISSETRLRIITEGILTRRLLEDPALHGVGIVVLDEFHERSLHADLALAMLREVRAALRPDLKIVVMSATLDAEPVADFLGCPIFRVPGRTYPVEIENIPAPMSLDQVPRSIAELIESRDLPGDSLVFLPGKEEIRRTESALAPIAASRRLRLIPLHGSLSVAAQTLALRPAAPGWRKIVLATNIAETSLTIDGIVNVIDSGLARIAGHDPRRGMDTLEVRRISLASATHRAGRAGRTAPGRCIRLYSAKDQAQMQPFELPEVRRVDLAQTVLVLGAWGTRDPRRFDWYEPPDSAMLDQARGLLEMLGAVADDGQLTPAGRRMLAIPIHPRLARLLTTARDWGLLADAASIAALISEPDILRPAGQAPLRLRRPTTRGESDILHRLDILDGSIPPPDTLDLSALHQVRHLRDELLRTIGASAEKSRAPSTDSQALLKLLMLAYPDRIARRRHAGSDTAIMVGGQGIRLAPESIVWDGPFFVAVDARVDERAAAGEARVRMASAIDEAWLAEQFPQSLRRVRSTEYDPLVARVVSRLIDYYRDLPLREHANAPVDPAEAGRVLAEALRPRASELFACDEACKTLLARVALLRTAAPEHLWPAFDDHQLADILADACAGKRSLAEVAAPGLATLLRARLEYPLDRRLEELAPEAIAVPTGNRIHLQYQPARPPLLPVRLQELFGLADTPRIAGGRIAVLLQLLGPNYRPVQLTDDLRSFWANTYPRVRKDLRARYPKHAWPEDPLTAPPQAKGQRRPR